MTDFSDIFDMEWAPATATATATAKAADKRAGLEAEYRALEAEHATIGVNQAWDNKHGWHLHPDDEKRLAEIEARLAEIEGVLS